MKMNRGLGRGLSALFSDTEEAYENASKQPYVTDTRPSAPLPEDIKGLMEVDIDLVRPNPNQPRKHFDEDALNELADSIKKHGLIMPIVVNNMEDGKYMIIAGERRYRAAKIAGKTQIPVVVRAYTDREIKEISLIENLQREDLNPIEAANAMKQLMDEYHLTQEELAQRLGKSQSSIANKLRLLRLPEEVKTAMADAHLTERHARALLKLRDEKTQLELVDKVAKKSLSVKETEKLVDKTLNKLFDEKSDGARPRPRILRIVKDYRLFMNTINAAVNTLREAGMTVAVEQQDREDGVDIRISVTR